MSKKTLITRAVHPVRERGVDYTEHVFDYKRHPNAVTAAEAIGLDSDVTVKTIVFNQRRWNWSRRADARRCRGVDQGAGQSHGGEVRAHRDPKRGRQHHGLGVRGELTLGDAYRLRQRRESLFSHRHRHSTLLQVTDATLADLAS